MAECERCRELEGLLESRRNQLALLQTAYNKVMGKLIERDKQRGVEIGPRVEVGNE